MNVPEAWEKFALAAGGYRNFAFLMGWYGDDICKVDAADLKAAAVALALAAFDAGEDGELCTSEDDNVLGLPTCRCYGGERRCAKFERAEIAALTGRVGPTVAI
jgi:hypothetical protein